MSESNFTFYKVDSSEEVLRRYLESHDNLYDKTRILVTKRFLLKHINLQSMNVLEIGCGGGIWSAFFADKVASLTCCDIRPHVIEAAKLHVSRQVFGDHLCHINWFAGDVKRLSTSIKYDLIFLKDVIEHVEDDYDFIKNIAALLKPRGFLYIATQNSLSLNYLIEGAYNSFRGNQNWCGWDPTHLRFYNIRTLMDLAHETGFQIFAKHGMYHIPYRFISRILFKKVVEYKSFHIIERIFGEYWPFSETGWAIGILMQKRGDKC